MSESQSRIIALNLPPYDTCRLCRNAMNEKCLEVCAPAKDYSWFELQKGVRLEDMPRFPIRQFEEMLPKVRTKVIALYIAKMFDYLTGQENDRANYHDFLNRLFPEGR